MIRAAAFDTALGRLFAAATPRGLCVVGLSEERGRCLLAEWIERHEPDAQVAEDEAALAALTPLIERMQRWAEGAIDGFLDVDLDLRGSAFQVEVWGALRRIPHGQTRTYAQIADEIGRPKALRAVGGANGANPVPLVVPCHRVVASSGLGGFSGGFDRKRRMLEIEGALLPFA